MLYFDVYEVRLGSLLINGIIIPSYEKVSLNDFFSKVTNRIERAST